MDQSVIPLTFMISQLMRKPLMTNIIERCLLVAKKVFHKSPIDIAPISSTLYVINGSFMFQPKMANYSNDHSSDTGHKKFILTNLNDIH